MPLSDAERRLREWMKGPEGECLKFKEAKNQYSANRLHRHEGSPLRELEQVVTHLSTNQVQWLLHSLKEEGKARVEGRAKAALWYPAVRHEGGDSSKPQHLKGRGDTSIFVLLALETKVPHVNSPVNTRTPRPNPAPESGLARPV